MKAIKAILFVLTSLFALATVSAGDLKVATLDLDRVLAGYHKAQDALKTLILNASRLHPESSDVLFARNVTDLTGEVLARLNSAKP